jgi:lambda repressor-like predicted transcriptional regulator
VPVSPLIHPHHPAIVAADPVRAVLCHRMRVDGTSLLELAATLRLPLRTLRRVQRSELLAWTVADRCAVALGYHPCQLWPQWFGPDARGGSGEG